MKTALLILIVFCTAAALGQTAGVISSQPQVVQIMGNPLHAETKPMATEHPLVGGGPSTYTVASGERPLWEFGPVSEGPSPLGDVAREYRREKQSSKKAAITVEKQGS